MPIPGRPSSTALLTKPSSVLIESIILMFDYPSRSSRYGCENPIAC
nr:MAG TPA: hypothetical protein [Bacteriophage sp.]